MDKKYFRELKRTLKKAGKKKLRKNLKDSLHNNPEEAHWDDVDYGEYNTKKMNGMDEKLS